jgi:sulfur carrier protein ThiS
MKKTVSVIVFVMFLLTPAWAQKKVTVSVTPADATISEVIAGSKDVKQLGIGSAVVTVPKNSSITIVLRKAGFVDLKKTYSTTTGEKLPKEDLLTMKDRQVTLKVWPADAKIFSNGTELEKGSTSIVVRNGDRINVEVKKPGYIPITRSYTNQSDVEPPINDEIKLKDRLIQIISSPSDAKIIVDNQLVGSGNADAIIPQDRCIVVKVIKDGYLEIEQTYCNKDELADLPVKETFTLQDRLVMVRATPEDVAIKINGRFVAKGEYNVKIAKGDCVAMTAEKEGFVTVRKNYCNQDNAPIIPVIDHVDMLVDETFAMSSPSDSVNVNNIIEINPNLSDAEAWKVMSQIVMNVFDVIEVTDKATGYLRTSWAAKSFPNNTIRTRIIVKVADSNKLKYAVKLCSESSGKSGSNINDDSSFTEWHRILLEYRNVLNNIQLRLK